MRLTGLKGKNFRSYRTLDLDLTQVRAAVIGGPIGSGKSAAFVDLPMWVLYGKTRSTRADEFITLGEKACMGEVRWTSSGTLYRAIRTRSLVTKAGKSGLELTAWSGKKWEPAASGNSIAETEREIERIIGASYDVLVSSSISPQGESNRFTDPPRLSFNGREYAGASARAQVLYQMTGATLYERLRVKALETMREFDQRSKLTEAAMRADRDAAGQLDAALSAITGSESRLTLLRAEIDECLALLTSLDTTIAEQTASVSALTDRQRGVAEDARRAADIAARFVAARESLTVDRVRIGDRRFLEAEAATLDEATLRLRDAEQRWRESDALVVRLTTTLKGLRPQQDDGERAYTKAAKEIDVLDGEIRAGEDAMHGHDILAERKALAEEVATLRHRYDDATAARRKLEEKLLTVSQARERLHVLQSSVEQLHAETRSEVAVLTASLTTNERAASVRDTVPCLTVGDLASRCPLLSDANKAADHIPTLRDRMAACHARTIPTELSEEIEALKDLASRGARYAEESKHLGVQVFECNARLRTLEGADVTLAALQSVATRVQLHRERLPDMEINAIRLSDALIDLKMQAEQYTGDLEAAEATRVAVDANVRTQRQVLTTAQAAVSALAALTETERTFPERERVLAELERQAAEIQARLAERATLTESLEAARHGLATAHAQRKEVAVRVTDLRAGEREALDALAASRATATAAASAQEKIADLQSAWETDQRRLGRLKALEAFYRQAPLMIIENESLPFLTHEINDILGRISPSRMRVEIETQREVKKSEILADTLDIVVSDEAGTRTLESYSGGQRFQVDLAIRIALAKLQAHRSGVQIETFIIDEGFGTQSRESLTEIIAALRGIQSEFPLLLLVSHVEELRDTFDTFIGVEGGPMNSVATIY